MSKIFNHYNDNLDRAWYDSSTIIYSECDDKDGELKTLRVTFKDGRTYEYYDVKVNDYLLFREDISQGKALNRIIKAYETKKIDPIDVENIYNDLEKLRNGENEIDGIEVVIESDVLTVIDNKEITFRCDFKKGELISVEEVLELLNRLKIKIKE